MPREQNWVLVNGVSERLKLQYTEKQVLFHQHSDYRPREIFKSEFKKSIYCDEEAISRLPGKSHWGMRWLVPNSVALFVWQSYTRENWELGFVLLPFRKPRDTLAPSRKTGSHSGLQPRNASHGRPPRPPGLHARREAPLRADTDLRGLRNAQAPRNLSSNCLWKAGLFQNESGLTTLPGFAGFRNDGRPGSGWRGDAREITPSEKPASRGCGKPEGPATENAE